MTGAIETVTMTIRHTCGHPASYPASPDPIKRAASEARLAAGDCNGCKAHPMYTLRVLIRRLYAGQPVSALERRDAWRRAENQRVQYSIPEHGRDPEASLLAARYDLDRVEGWLADEDWAALGEYFTPAEDLYTYDICVEEDADLYPILIAPAGLRLPMDLLEPRVSRWLEGRRERVAGLERDHADYLARVAADPDPDYGAMPDQDLLAAYLASDGRCRRAMLAARELLRRRIDGSPSVY